MLYLFGMIEAVPSLIVTLSAVLIDIDHLPELANKSFRELIKPGVFFSRSRFLAKAKHSFQTYLLLFHTVEFVMLLFVISFFVPIIFFIALGFALHILQDFISQYGYFIPSQEKNLHAVKYWFLTGFILRKSFRAPDHSQDYSHKDRFK